MALEPSTGTYRRTLTILGLVERRPHIHPYNVWYGVKSTCYGDQSEIFWEMCYLIQGLESEGRGLPGDVSSGATCVGFTSAHLCALARGVNRGVKPRCESGRSQRTMGSLAGFPWLGECSPNSITLLLHSQETAGRVSGSLHTRPIQSMAKPSKVWGKTVTAGAVGSRSQLLVGV